MKISVIIPVYNEAEFVKRSIDSVIGKADEIIVVDDGSTDGSSEILNLYGGRGEIKLYRHLKSRGVSEARNYGLDRATGDYITFLDADDEWAQDAILHLRKAAAMGENIVQFNHIRHYVVGGAHSEKVRFEARPQWYTAHIRPSMWEQVWNKLFKREFIEKNKLRFLKGLQFGEDEIFSLEAMLANEGVRCVKYATVVKHFENKQSLCHTVNSERLFAQLAALHGLADTFKNTGNTKGALEVEYLIESHEKSDLYRKVLRGE